jgi:hypothetical protein
MTISNFFGTKYIYFLSGLITIVFLLSCESEEDFSCIIDSNTPIEKKILLDDFDQIGLYIKGNVTIEQGKEASISLKGNSTLVDSLYTGVENKKLIIELRSPYCTPTIPLEIIVTTPQITAFTLAEKSNTVVADFKNLQKLKIQVKSNSKVALNELEGLNVLDISLQEGAHIISYKEIKEVDLLKVNIKGNGSFNGYPIAAQNVEIKIEGKGSCEVTALRRLEVDIIGNANVYCMGMPKIHKRITGKGDVHFTN